MTSNEDGNEIRNRKQAEPTEEEFETIEATDEKEDIKESDKEEKSEDAGAEKKKPDKEERNLLLTIVNTSREIILRLVLFFIVYLVINRLYKIIFK